MGYYPDGRESGATKLPHGVNIKRLPLSKVKVFVPVRGSMLQCFRYKGGNPEMFVDLVTPREEYKFMKDTELHLGISGHWELEPIFDSAVKQNRIDLYLPAEHIPSFIEGLKAIEKPE